MQEFKKWVLRLVPALPTQGGVSESSPGVVGDRPEPSREKVGPPLTRPQGATRTDGEGEEEGRDLSPRVGVGLSRVGDLRPLLLDPVKGSGREWTPRVKGSEGGWGSGSPRVERGV